MLGLQTPQIFWINLSQNPYSTLAWTKFDKLPFPTLPLSQTIQLKMDKNAWFLTFWDACLFKLDKQIIWKPLYCFSPFQLWQSLTQDMKRSCHIPSSMSNPYNLANLYSSTPPNTQLCILPQENNPSQQSLFNFLLLSVIPQTIFQNYMTTLFV